MTKARHKTFSKPSWINKNFILISLIGILALTFLSYLPLLKANFTNWDDPFHLHYNQYIQELNWHNVKRIFLTTVLLVYIPLTMLTFAIEHHFFGFNPFVFHLDNLLLHLLTTFIVFKFFSKLGFESKMALFMTLIFAIHPMHVESVGWITERKDVLYGAFYMLCLIQYWQFLTTKKKSYYWLAWLWGLLSILAKPMAISLPLVLLLLDWLHDPKKIIKPILVKIPFVFYVFPIMTISHVHNVGTFAVHPNLWDAILIFFWTLSFYIYTFILPIKLNPFWETPEPISLSNPIYALSLAIFIATMIFLYIQRRNRWCRFGFVFFLSSIFFLLRFDKQTNATVVADRFNYLPMVGLIIMFTAPFQHFFLKHLSLNIKSKFIFYSMILIIAGLCVKTFAQTFVWQNSFSLWNHVLTLNPQMAIAYNNRGAVYLEMGKAKEALKDFDRAIELKPDYSTAIDNRGLSYSMLKKYDSALENHKNALKMMPNSFQTIFNIAGVYSAMKKNEEALEEYKKVLKINPSHTNTYVNISVILRRQEKFEEAEEFLHQASKLNPNDGNVYFNWGAYYEDVNNVEKAKESYLKSLELNPNILESYNNLARIYINANELDRAMDLLNRAIKIVESPDFYTSRGVIFDKQRQFDLAFKDYSKAIELEPTYIEAFANRSLMYFRRGNFDLALADVNQALKLDPQSTISLTNRGIILSAQKKLEQAKKDFDQALSIDPSFEKALSARANLFCLIQKYDLALKDINAALTLNPKSAENLDLRGFILLMTKKYAEAEKDFRQAISLDKNFSNAYVNLGNISLLNKDYTSAFNYFDQAIQLNPYLDEAYSRRGSIYIGLNEIDLALKDLNQAIQLNPNNADAYLNRGTIFGNRKEFPSAIEDYTSAIRLDPNRSVLYTNRGATLLLANQLSPAIEDFNQAIKLDPTVAVNYYYRSIAYKRSNNLEEALKDAEEAQSLHQPGIDLYLKELHQLMQASP